MQPQRPGPPNYGPPPPQQPNPGYGQPPVQAAYPYDPRYGAPQQYAGYVPYPAGPPAKSKSDGAIIAVVVVVVVLVLLVVPLVLYVMVTGLTASPGQTRPTITLSSGSWSGGSLVISITSASTSVLDSSSLTFQIITNSGEFYYNGASGATIVTGTTSTTVTYNDAGGPGASRVGPDDNIAVTASPNPNPLRGATFRVLQGADILGSAVLP